MVSYGNASRQPVLLPTGLFVNKNIKLKSFNFETWLSETSQEQRQEIIDHLSDLVCSKKLNIWVESL